MYILLTAHVPKTLDINLKITSNFIMRNSLFLLHLNRVKGRLKWVDILQMSLCIKMEPNLT